MEQNRPGLHIGWKPVVIGWSKNWLGLLITELDLGYVAMHCWLIWQVGIPAIFSKCQWQSLPQYRLQSLAVKDVHGDCERVYCQPGAHFTIAFSHHNSNSMGILFYCYSTSSYDITTNFCTCQDSYAVLSCPKICSDQYIRRWMTVKLNLQGIMSEWNPSLPHTSHTFPVNRGGAT